MNFLLRIRQAAGNLFRNHKLTYFLHGLFVFGLFYAYTENAYEEQLFGAIAQNVRSTMSTEALKSEDSIVNKCLSMTHYLEARRRKIFGDTELKGFKAEILQPVTFDLMTGKGACGSSSYVMGRLLREFDIPFRFGQMKVNGIYGGHIIVEAYVNGKWRALDPLYELKFIDQKGQLASFTDVQTQWNYYKQQVPVGYDTSYRYEDVQYTNWNKIPVVMPVFKQILSWVKGEEYVKTVSVRVWVLSKYKVIFRIGITLYLSLLLIRLYLYRHKPLKKATELLQPINKKFSAGLW